MAWLLELFEVSVVVDHVPVRVAAVDPGQGGRGRAPPGHDGGDREVGIAQPPDRLVHGRESLLEVLAAAPGGSQGTEGGRPETGGGWPGSGGVGDGKPGAVAVLDEVKPVSAHLVGGQQRARQLAAGDTRDTRRKQVLLDLRGRGGGLSPTRGLDVIRVVVGQLQRRGALLGDVGQRRHRFAQTQQ